MMRKSIPIIILFSLVLIIIFAIPITSYAADDDFEVSYSFSPNPLGKAGGDVQLRLTIRNTGTTNITWVDVVINTASAYNRHWSATITPGSSRTVTYIVPFGSSDVNKEKLLQVSMNNNITANPDGVKMFRFEIDGSDNIISINSTISPARTVYHPGDTVTVSYSVRNNSTTHAITDVEALSSITRTDPFYMLWIKSNDFGNVFPGAQKSDSFSYTFTDSNIGMMNLEAGWTFRYSGGRNSVGKLFMRVNVEEEEPDVDFTTHLTANPIEIDAGDTVRFHVTMNNIGDDRIATFEIRNSEGGLEASTESMASGASGSVNIDVPIHESTNVSYVVIGKKSGVNVSKETNSVRITVRDPEAAEAAEGPTSMPAVTPTSSAMLDEGDELDLNEEALGDEDEDNGVEPVGFNFNTMDNQEMMLYIMFGIVALVILIAVIIVVAVANKYKNK